MVMMPPWVAQRFEALERFGILFVFGLALILPALLSEFGVRFNPVADWAVGGARFILSGVYGITS
jgi:ABC-type antimicrobial peptide transport system permease subunit